MKDQHMKSEKRSVLRVLSVFLLMLAITVFALSVSVSAANAQGTLTIEEEDLAISGAVKDEVDGKYTVAYGDTNGITVALKSGAVIDGLKGDDQVDFTLGATLTSTDAGDCELVVTVAISGDDAYKYAIPATLRLPARVTPIALEWEEGKTAEVEITYDPTVSSYKVTAAAVQAKLPALKTSVDGLALSVVDVKEFVANKIGTYNTTATVATGNANYTVADVPVTVTVKPIVIDDIDWDGANKWTYGDKMPVSVRAYSGTVAHNVIQFSCEDAKFAAGDAGSYTLVASLTNPNFVFADTLDNTAKLYTVTIEPKKFVVSMEDVTVIGDETTNFNVAVKGELPPSVLSLITYSVNDQAFTGTNAYGVYEVSATLPSGNYVFYNDLDQRIDEPLKATLTIKRQQKLIPVFNDKGEQVGNVILVNRDGFLDTVTAVATAIEGYPDIVKNNRYNQVFNITVQGADEGDTFSIIIPLWDELLIPRTDKLTLADLCIYESSNNALVSAQDANKGYAVTLGEGYFQLDNYSPAKDITLVISPDYTAPFFTTAPGILVIILIVLAVLVGLFYIGLYLRKILDTRENPVLVIDTDGVLPEHEPIEVPAKEEVDVDAVLDENLDEMAEAMDGESAEDDAVAEDEDVDAAVEEALETLAEEAAEIELDEETEIPEEITEEIAEDTAEEAADQTETEEAAAETAEEAINESADAEDAVVLVEEPAEEAAEEVVEEAAEEVVEEVAEEAVETMATADDEDSDADDAETDDDDDTFSFGDADVDNFIDVMENPEAYAEMLERERRGEIRIISRYKKSFTAKLSQSQGNVMDYYNEIKNALLSFKGVKGRVSWNYEAFNKGRAHVAKMDAKSKSLYLYLALNPEDLVDTKYNFVDVSAKKKYATTPVLMKIKGDRKFKHALELVEKLCGEQMLLSKLEAEAVDYRVPRMTIEEMVEAGIMKHNAGYITLIEEAAPAVEEAPVEEIAVEAEAAPVEEAAVEAEIAPVEDIPANAEADTSEEV